MILKTSTVRAPWTVVEGESKYYVRIKILQTVVKKLSLELNFDPFASPAGAVPETKDSKDKKRKRKN